MDICEQFESDYITFTSIHYSLAGIGSTSLSILIKIFLCHSPSAMPLLLPAFHYFTRTAFLSCDGCRTKHLASSTTSATARFPNIIAR